MSIVEVFALPSRLRTSSEVMANIIRWGDFDSLFLDFSRNLNDLVRALAEGVPYEKFLERAVELNLTPKPVSSWRYWAEPILLAVRGLLNKRKRLGLWCYRLPSSIRLSEEMAERIARLTLRTSISRDLKVMDWISTIREYLESSKGSLEKEARYIASRARNYEKSVCIAGMNGRFLKEHLLDLGVNAELRYLILPYHYVPIEILIRLIQTRNRDLKNEIGRIKEIIRNHVSFIRDYVLTSQTYDEAYCKWIRDVAPWLKINWLSSRLIHFKAA